MKGRPRNFSRTLVYFSLFMLVFTCASAAAVTGTVALREDFTTGDLGGFPVGWEIEGNPGYIAIVEDPELEVGRAVRIASDPQSRETRITRALSLPEDDPEVLVIEHQVRWVRGRGVNLYVFNRGNNVNWYVDQYGVLSYRLDSGQVAVGKLQGGWNRVRLVANRVRNEVYVYLNDMEKPAAGPLPFRVPTDSWRGAKFRIQHTYAAEGPSEVFYGDITVTTADGDVTASADGRDAAVSVADRTSAPQVTVAALKAPARTSVWVGDRPTRPVPELPTALDATVELERVPLSVPETAGIARRSQPVTSGVPLPAGHVWQESQVRLVDVRGREIPLQTSVLSRWPDGSIRWLLLDFQIDLAAGETAEVIMEYGTRVRRTPHAGITVMEGDTEIAVDTGALTVVFGTDGPLIRRVAVAGQEIADAGFELLIRAANGLAVTTEAGPRLISVEESGPERTVVRVQGELYAGVGSSFINFAYDLRFHFYRGLAVMRIDPTITNLLGTYRIVHGFTEIEAVTMHLMGRGTPGTRTYHVGGAEGMPASGAKTLELRQFQSRQFTVYADGSLLAEGERAPGWIEFMGPGEAVGVGVRHYWQQFPKSIVIGDEGITVHLWAPGGETLQMTGGEAKRHEVYVSLDTHLSGPIAPYLYPLRAVAAPEWYSATEAFGRPLFVVREDDLPFYDESVAQYEAFVEGAYKQLLDSRDLYNEYGWRNFGDWSTTWDPDGWGNSEYDLAYTYFQQFARTGDLRYFELAETAARHWMDVDLIWATDDIVWLGGGMQHSTTHRSYAGDHHTWNQGMIDYYLLTGDRRSLEAARAVGDFFAYLAFERPERHRPRLHQNPQRDVNPRSPGWGLIALVAIYEATLDPYYLEAARTVVNILEAEQEEDGQWPYLIPENEVPGRPIRTKPFMTALVLRGLGDYYRVTKDERAFTMMVRGLRYLVDELWSETGGGYPYIDHPSFSPAPSSTNLLLLDAFAYAYEKLQDQELLEVALKGFKAMARGFSNSVRDRHLGKTVASNLRHTAHSLAVLMQPRDVIVSAPATVQIGRERESTVALTVARLDTRNVLSGRLTLAGLPEGMSVKDWDPDYEIPVGERAVTLPLTFEIEPTLAPGSYSISIRDSRMPEVSRTVTVQLPGWRVVDPYDPPLQQHAWFGDWSFDVSEEKSSGWIYDEGTAQEFFSDPGRLRRTEATDEYLIYNVQGFFDFVLTVYARADAAATAMNNIHISFSRDGETWETIATSVEWEERQGGSYFRGTIMPQERSFRGDGKLKIRVFGPGEPDAIQLGRLEITGWQ